MMFVHDVMFYFLAGWLCASGALVAYWTICTVRDRAIGLIDAVRLWYWRRKIRK